MKNIALLLSTMLVSLSLFSFSGKDKCLNSDDINCYIESHNPFAEGLLMDEEVRNLSLEDIDLIEEEEEIVLNFDPTPYLPLDFNAYRGMGFDLTKIVVREMEEEIVLGFDPAQYLPIGFNAYQGMELNLNNIIIEEIEEEIDLGFEVMNYLPKGFDAYAK
ncbi:hypothetical protein QSE00_21685 [Arenibacter sp. M-2]|uniref:hypothetical protein n=1 Tax=Arenibacter sp. M-2 TaxID=3053612 RepID=UPI0025704E1D|nr:hypothetical protein [Arenibacter sp. M-2]MDL5514440.1 hypothetical protein [Arenibacter sp. M-2]